jgi:toxin-antitoxin system PIN domain toxin
VKLPDANILLYAVDRGSSRHAGAKRWLEEHLSGAETVAFAWVVLLAFLRLSTNPAVFESPLASGEALDLIEGWLAQPPATVVHPTERHPRILRDLLEPVGTAGNLSTDAHVAALAIEHGATLASFDRDFGRFPGLRWVEPG